ncbi:MAG: hypothetical protein BWY42_01208 [Candidatus Omnitrophica bacterium ADurb.Bin277]|nr:MAG: hypothetical protein BWY42_01208 [Candidatus Omnitrophica bacterium ADurb.Bin277]
MILEPRKNDADNPEGRVDNPEEPGAAARAHRVQKIINFFMFYRMRHRDPGELFGCKRGLDAFCFGHNPRYAEADIIRAFITDHLERHAGHSLALEMFRCRVRRHRAIECGEESRGRGSESGTNDINVHLLAVSGHVNLSCHKATKSHAA